MSNTKLKKLALVKFAALIGGILLNAPAFAADDTIYETITQSQLIKLIELSGDKGTASGDDLIYWEINSKIISALSISDDLTKVKFLFNNANLHGTLEKTNQWNKTKILSRSYINKDGDAFLEIILNLEGGVTEANILNFLKICGISLQAFVNEMR
jgi:hypothetical protein